MLGLVRQMRAGVFYLRDGPVGVSILEAFANCVTNASYTLPVSRRTMLRAISNSRLHALSFLITDLISREGVKHVSCEGYALFFSYTTFSYIS